MSDGAALGVAGIRDAEILAQDAANGVKWLDGNRHLLQAFDADNKHTIPLSGDPLYSSVR